MQQKIKRKLLSICIATLLAIGFGATSCSEEGGYDGAKPIVYADSSKPVVITDFSPKEGPVRTLVFIEGDEFRYGRSQKSKLPWEVSLLLSLVLPVQKSV